MPSTRIDPPAGLTRPSIALSVLVLPAPLGPSSPKISPSLIENDTPSTATLGPYVTRRSETSSAGCSLDCSSCKGSPMLAAASALAEEIKEVQEEVVDVEVDGDRHHYRIALREVAGPGHPVDVENQEGGEEERRTSRDHCPEHA